MIDIIEINEFELDNEECIEVIYQQVINTVTHYDLEACFRKDALIQYMQSKDPELIDSYMAVDTQEGVVQLEFNDLMEHHGKEFITELLTEKF